MNLIYILVYTNIRVMVENFDFEFSMHFDSISLQSSKKRCLEKMSVVVCLCVYVRACVRARV